jgi:uncharacterized membrane protein YfcA
VVEVLLNIFAFFKTLFLLLRALLNNWVQIIIGAFILILIFKFIDTIWLKWFLTAMTGGAFFYSIYDNINLYVQDKAFEAVKKLDPEARERVMKKYEERKK